MEQSKIESAIEATTDMVFGMLVSFLVWMFVIPVLWPEHASKPATGIGIVLIFTITSWIRRYCCRRFFARRFHKVVVKFVRSIL